MPPHDEIWDILDNLEICDGDIVFITSKILAIHQGRCTPLVTSDELRVTDGNKTVAEENLARERRQQKIELVKSEAQAWYEYKNRGGFGCCLTITDNILIPNAGIDESNANGHLILWPKNVDALCREIRAYLCKKHGLKRLGVVSTDSHTTPLRWGVTGITTGFCGIEPLRDLRGQPDIFGRKIQTVRVNQIDPLTSLAVLLMGETNETTPIVVLRGYQNIKFNTKSSMRDFALSPEEDIYGPLFDNMTKNNNRKN